MAYHQIHTGPMYIQDLGRRNEDTTASVTASVITSHQFNRAIESQVKAVLHDSSISADLKHELSINMQEICRKYLHELANEKKYHHTHQAYYDQISDRTQKKIDERVSKSFGNLYIWDIVNTIGIFGLGMLFLFAK